MQLIISKGFLVILLDFSFLQFYITYQNFQKIENDILKKWRLKHRNGINNKNNSHDMSNYKRKKYYNFLRLCVFVCLKQL